MRQSPVGEPKMLLKQTSTAAARSKRTPKVLGRSLGLQGMVT
jgi:hypothetical protein